MGRKKSEVRRTTAPISVRLTPEQAALLRHAATERKLSLSEFIRERALAKPKLESNPASDEPHGWRCNHYSITASHMIGMPSVSCGCQMAPLAG